MLIRHAIVGGFLGFIAIFVIDSDPQTKILLVSLFAGIGMVAGSILEVYFPAAAGKRSVADEDVVE